MRIFSTIFPYNTFKTATSSYLIAYLIKKFFIVYDPYTVLFEYLTGGEGVIAQYKKKHHQGLTKTLKTRHTNSADSF